MTNADKNLAIQYQLSNGRWTDADDAQVERFLQKVIKFNKLNSRDEAVELLGRGGHVRHDTDWYANVRIKRPAEPVVVQSFEQATGICEQCGYGRYECECCAETSVEIETAQAVRQPQAAIETSAPAAPGAYLELRKFVFEESKRAVVASSHPGGGSTFGAEVDKARWFGRALTADQRAFNEARVALRILATISGRYDKFLSTGPGQWSDDPDEQNWLNMAADARREAIS